MNKKYYASSHWRNFRNKLLNDPDCTCEICGRKRWGVYKRDTKKHKKGDLKLLLNFNIHHKHYDTLNRESREDVLTLCRNCHEIGHKLEKCNIPGLYDWFCNNTAWEYRRRK